MNRNGMIYRSFWTIISVVINAFGVAMITYAALGTVPATSIPAVLGIAFKPTIGMFTLVLSIIQIVLQIVILRKDFQWFQLLQIVPSVVLSYFIDFFLGVLKCIPLDSYIAQFIMMLAAIVVLGYSIALEVYEDVLYLPLDGFNKAIATASGKSFDVIKIIVDCSMVAIAIILSFIFLGKLDGIREGTVISAILAGFAVRFFTKVFFSKPRA